MRAGQLVGLLGFGSTPCSWLPAHLFWTVSLLSFLFQVSTFKSKLSVASNLFCVMLSQTADISHEQLTSNTYCLACCGTEHSQAISRSIVLTTYVTTESPGEVGGGLVQLLGHQTARWTWSWNNVNSVSVIIYYLWQRATNQHLWFPGELLFLVSLRYQVRISLLYCYCR